MVATTGIAREIKQRIPFRTPAEEAAVALLRSADLLRRHLSAVVGPHGLTLQQFNVLRILRGAEPSGLPTLDVAERMIEQTPGITRLLDRLEAKKLAARNRDPRDRRQVVCRIAPLGLRRLGELDAAMAAAAAAVFECLGHQGTQRLIELLDATRRGVAAGRTQPAPATKGAPRQE